jgi:hypothetical protein
MPYKDLERKREWEREHREQRNARRRARIASADQQSVETMIPEPIPGQNSAKPASLPTASMICLFIVAALLAEWCFRNVLRSSART